MDDFEFERKIPIGISHCTGDFEFKRRIPIGIFLCTGDFEFDEKFTIGMTLSLNEKDPYRDFPCTGQIIFPLPRKKNVV